MVYRGKLKERNEVKGIEKEDTEKEMRTTNGEKGKWIRKSE